MIEPLSPDKYDIRIYVHYLVMIWHANVSTIASLYKTN